MAATEHGGLSGWPARVGILGAAGLIGSGVAAAVATSGACRELHLVDPKTDLLRAHAIDIAEAQLAAGGATTTLAISAADAVPEVDLAVVAAAAPETPAGDRKDPHPAARADPSRTTVIDSSRDRCAATVKGRPVRDKIAACSTA